MRSYYAHLTTTATSSQGAIIPRPVFRSSAIFPVLQKPGISSRILFMGYWILKRHIQEIHALVTLRNLEGQMISRYDFLIRESKTYRVELTEALALAGITKEQVFEGSLEIEFFSTQNLFFPFPAVVINYYGPQFSTMVHTAQRIYNDFDDKLKNSQTAVPESGFNLYANEEAEPFIGLINGCAPVEASTLHLQFFNHANQTLDCSIDLGNLNPYQTTWIYPARHCNLKQFLEGKPGTAKARFHVDWIFPRLVVGNFNPHLPALSITHTYYDCSAASSSSDYWQPEIAGWHAAALMVPCEISHDHFTNIYFYPIYSPATFALDLEFYNRKGELLGSKRNAATVTAEHAAWHRLPLREYSESLGLNLQDNYAARIISRPLEKGLIPARIKLGLDIGNCNGQLPCNICTNLQPFNPSLENKSSTFRWSPILADQPKATLWLMNSAPAVEYNREAALTLTFFRESDTQTLMREITLPPNGFHILFIAQDKELNAFFQQQVGWMTLISSNPYTTTYYFTENASGIVGGDHGF